MNRDPLIRMFQDTMHRIRSTPALAAAVEESVQQTILYREGETPSLPAPQGTPEICVTAERSFAAAMRLREACPEARIAVHNFASATNPGGGVQSGARAQEECLCRISTLYPVLADRRMWDGFYGFHRERHDALYTDSCLYTPGIRILKSDDDAAILLPEPVTVDVITCAAPNLRAKPSNRMNPDAGDAVQIGDAALKAIHIRRARHMLTAAAANGAEILVLGAFGCGAFRNDPHIVAQAYREVLAELGGHFQQITFAVYCPPHNTENYDVFSAILGDAHA